MVLSILLPLTMQNFKVFKKKPRSSRPPRNETLRLQAVADSISVDENKAMVACSECVKHDAVCYYDRSQSVKCAECLRCRRDCDGTFSLEEFRKIGEQKKLLKRRARERRLETSRLRTLQSTMQLEARRAKLAADEARQALLATEAAAEERLAEAMRRTAAAELEEAALAEQIARLKETSSRMLKREMLALGVMDPLDSEQEVALAEPEFAWTGSELPVMESFDWSVVPDFAGGTPQPASR